MLGSFSGVLRTLLFPGRSCAAAATACLLAAALLTAGCGGAAEPDEDKPAPVVTARVQQRDVPRSLAAVGNVQAAASVEVKPQVGGQIIAAPVASGQDVQAGQTLFQIDPRPYEASVKEAEASLLRNRVLLKKALEDLSRFSRLADQDVVSREAYDQAVADADSQRALVAQDEAYLASAKLQLEYSTITAPVSGRVGEVLIDAGNVVKANDDRTLLVINTLAPAKVAFAVPERYLPEIMNRFRQGEIAVTAVPEGFAGPPPTGRLTSIDNAVDASTGTIKLEARFENKELALWPGQFVRVRLDLETIRDALVVSGAAVLEGVIGQYVYVVDAENTAEVRRVKARYVSGEEMLIEEGLRPGERVVIDGQLNLAAGVKVLERGAAQTAGPGAADGRP